MIGPTLPELRQILRACITEISYGLMVRAGAYSLGAVLFGYLFGFMNKQISLALSSLVFAVGTLTLPFFNSLTVFIVFQAFTGLAGSGIDVASNSWLIQLWSSDCAPYLQGLYFSYALGATISPIVVGPFLLTQPNMTDCRNFANGSSRESEFNYKNNPIRIPFAITTAIQLFAIASLLVAYCFRPYESRKGVRRESSGSCVREGVRRESSCVREGVESSPYHYTIIGLASMTVFTEIWCEMNVFDFLQTFAQRSGWTERTGAFMTSAFAGSFTVSRGVAAVAATRVTPSTIYYTCFLVGVSGNIVLFASPSSLWISVILLGLGYGAVQPAIVAFISQEINVSARVCGFLSFVSNSSSILNPLLVGSFIERSPMVFAHASSVGIIVQITAVVVLHTFILHHRKNVLISKS